MPRLSRVDSPYALIAVGAAGLSDASSGPLISMAASAVVPLKGYHSPKSEEKTNAWSPHIRPALRLSRKKHTARINNLTPTSGVPAVVRTGLEAPLWPFQIGQLSGLHTTSRCELPFCSFLFFGSLIFYLTFYFTIIFISVN